VFAGSAWPRVAKRVRRIGRWLWNLRKRCDAQVVGLPNLEPRLCRWLFVGLGRGGSCGGSRLVLLARAAGVGSRDLRGGLGRQFVGLGGLAWRGFGMRGSMLVHRDGVDHYWPAAARSS